MKLGGIKYLYEIGDQVTVVSNKTGHGYVVGTNHRISRDEGRNVWRLERPSGGGNRGSSILEEDMQPCWRNRKEETAFYEKVIYPAFTQQLEKITFKMEKLRKFNSKEEEIAQLLSEINEKGGDKKAIMCLLQEFSIINGEGTVEELLTFDQPGDPPEQLEETAVGPFD